MNVYDFDNTILRGDSTKRFYAFCLRRHPRMILRWPGLGLSFLRWKMGGMMGYPPLDQPGPHYPGLPSPALMGAPGAPVAGPVFL